MSHKFSVVTISTVKGTVQTRPLKSSGWIPARIKQPVMSGQMIQTSDGAGATLQCPDKSIVTVGRIPE